MQNWLLGVLLGIGLIGSGAPVQTQTAPDPVNLSALWYDSSEPGYGLTMTHQGSLVFVAWYTFGGNGQVLWLLAAVSRQPDGRYVGPIDRFDGQPFNLINNAQAWTTTARVGEARLQLREDGKLDFDYTVNGITQVKRLESLDFVADPPQCGFTTASRAQASNYTDVWWNPLESGWGMSIVHQGDLMFIAWYTYAANGSAQWISGLASKQPDGSYSGELNRPASGTPFNLIDGPATSFPVPVVGSFRLAFAGGENGAFEYTLDGISQSKPIERLVFVPPGTPVTLCVASDSGGGGGGGGSPDRCDPGLNVGDFRTSVTSFGDVVTERVIGPGTFQGQSVIVVDQLDGNEVLTNRNYMQVTDDQILTVGSEAFQNGQIALTTVFNPPASFRRNLAVGDSYVINYTGTLTGSGLNQSVPYTETVERKADASQTVPAGTFASCRFDRRIVAAGTTIDTDMWMSPLVGTVRTNARTQTPIGVIENLIQLQRARVNGVDYPN